MKTMASEHGPRFGEIPDREFAAHQFGGAGEFLPLGDAGARGEGDGRVRPDDDGDGQANACGEGLAVHHVGVPALDQAGGDTVVSYDHHPVDGGVLHLAGAGEDDSCRDRGPAVLREEGHDRDLGEVDRVHPRVPIWFSRPLYEASAKRFTRS